MVMRFSNRRGHAKLRLCSRKNYKPRPRKKRLPTSFPISIPLKNVYVFKVSLPLNLVSFKVSLPISAYTDMPLLSLDILHERLKHHNALPSGIDLIFQLCNVNQFIVFRMGEYSSEWFAFHLSAVVF